MGVGTQFGVERRKKSADLLLLSINLRWIKVVYEWEIAKMQSWHRIAARETVGEKSWCARNEPIDAQKLWS